VGGGEGPESEGQPKWVPSLMDREVKAKLRMPVPPGDRWGRFRFQGSKIAEIVCFSLYLKGQKCKPGKKFGFFPLPGSQGIRKELYLENYSKYDTQR